MTSRICVIISRQLQKNKIMYKKVMGEHRIMKIQKSKERKMKQTKQEKINTK